MQDLNQWVPRLEKIIGVMLMQSKAKYRPSPELRTRDVPDKKLRVCWSLHVTVTPIKNNYLHDLFGTFYF